MTARPIAPPEPDEYGAFFGGYIALSRESDPLELLRRQPSALRATCAGLSDSDALARYAPGKWSVKEVLGHLADTERVLSYRLFRISR
ncbi:MAG: DinB family protein, partial [Gemmatimonadota bacterium]|nr:DinB family protein [Gemmatimonadota bacterium]